MQTQLSEKAEAFLEALKVEWQVDHISSASENRGAPAVELSRIVIDDPTELSLTEINAVAEAFGSRYATVALECKQTATGDGVHPLVHLGEQLSTHIPARWPVTNQSDGPDGTVKIHDVGTQQDSRSLSSLGMAAHQDGWLSLRGVLSVTGLWADSVPARTAATYSTNVVHIALDLRSQDAEAFVGLFADDAIVVRRASDDSIVATSPVLYLRNGWTYSFFREPNDEFIVSAGNESARTGIDFLSERVAFGSPGSAFTYLDKPGRALLLNNRHCVHGRTSFTDDLSVGRKRVIASKWWICDPEDRSLVWD